MLYNRIRKHCALFIFTILGLLQCRSEHLSNSKYLLHSNHYNKLISTKNKKDNINNQNAYHLTDKNLSSNQFLLQLDSTPITPENVQQLTLKPVNAKLVNQIESIHVTPYDMIIQTSNVGSANALKIAIKVIEIENWHELPPINLTGIFILVTKGRYTIGFLKPNRWYGVVFRSEQNNLPSLPAPLPSITIGSSSTVIYEEYHLVKTHKEDGSQINSEPIISVSTKRLSNSGKSLENLIITIKWEQHPSERPNLDAILNLTLFCKQHIKYKQVRLNGLDLEKSVDVKLDNNFEIMEFYNKTRQIIASITPKNCFRICWNAELIAESPSGQHFRQTATHDCKTIVTISASTILRKYVGYKIHGGNLTIYTTYTPEKPNDYELDAYVELTAIKLAETKDVNNNTVEYKKINVGKKHNNDFVLQNLELNNIYAVEYNYAKISPFAYVESRRFILQTPKTNDEYISYNVSQNKAFIGKETLVYWPVQLIFEKIPPPLFLLKNKNKIAMNSEQPNYEDHVEPIYIKYGQDDITLQRKQVNITLKQKENLKIPKIIMQLNPLFYKYEIGIDLEPFCESGSDDLNKFIQQQEHYDQKTNVTQTNETNAKSHFWLNRDRPNRELCHLDVIGAVCGSDPAHILCQRYANSQIFHNYMNSVEKCRLGSKLCYTPSIRVAEKLYSMDTHCVDVAKRFNTEISKDWLTTTIANKLVEPKLVESSSLAFLPSTPKIMFLLTVSYKLVKLLYS